MGTLADDLIFPYGGWDVIDGKEGVDSVVVVGNSSEFKLIQEGGVVYVDSLSAASAYSERVQLINVELVLFTDRTIDLRSFSKKFYASLEQSEFFDGGLGIDELIYPSPFTQHKLQKAGDFFFIENTINVGVRDRISQVERIHFSDFKLALDLSGNAGSAARLVGALLGADFVQNPEIVGIALRALDSGMSQSALVQFARSTEFFHQLAGSDSDESLISHVFKNLMGQKIPQDILASYIDLLEGSPNRRETLNELVVSVSYSERNEQLINLVGLGEVGLVFV